jgi:hypothetical protein
MTSSATATSAIYDISFNSFIDSSNTAAGSGFNGFFRPDHNLPSSSMSYQQMLWMNPSKDARDILFCALFRYGRSASRQGQAFKTQEQCQAHHYHDQQTDHPEEKDDETEDTQEEDNEAEDTDACFIQVRVLPQ